MEWRIGGESTFRTFLCFSLCTSYTHGGRASNTRYDYRVRNNVNGVARRSDIISVLTAPGTAPTGLTAVRAAAGAEVVLNWNAVTVSPPAAGTVNYDVQVVFSADGNPPTDVSTYSNISAASGTSRTYTHTGRARTSNYFYRVRARTTPATGTSGGGNSPWSTPVRSEAILPAVLMTPTVTPNSVSLSWTAPTGGIPNDTRVQWRVGTSGAFTDIPITPATATTYTHPDRDPSTEYQYQIRSRVAGATLNSNIQSATTEEAPLAAADLRYVSNTNNEVVLEWDEATGGTITASNLRVVLVRDFSILDTISVLGVTTYTHTVVGNTRYQYRLDSTIDGTELESRDINVASALNAPTGFTANRSADGASVTLSWDAPTSGTAAGSFGTAASYSVQVAESASPAEGDYANVSLTNTAARSFIHTGRIAGTSYTYRVRGSFMTFPPTAYGGGDGPWTDGVQAVAEKPAVLRWVSNTNDEIVLEWDLATGGTITANALQWNDDGGSTFADISLAPAVTTYTHRDRDGNTGYTYRLSTAIGSTTLTSSELTAYTAPDALTGLSAMRSSAGTSVNLSWDLPTGDAGDLRQFSYTLQFAKGNPIGNYVNVTTTPHSDVAFRTFTHSGRNAGTAYTYRVRASLRFFDVRIGGGNGPWSAVAQVAAIESAPMFPGGTTIPALTMTANTLVQPTLPKTATGGNGDLRYVLTLSANTTGLSVASDRESLTGTSTTGTATATWTVTDDDGDTDTRMFTITVTPEVADTAPMFPGGTTIPALTMTAGTLVQPPSLPKTATRGNGDLRYVLTLSANSTGLSVTDGERLTGTSTEGTATATWTVSDSDTNTADSDADRRTFTITVTLPDTDPTFGSATIPALTMSVGRLRQPNLPTASGGNPPLRYALTLAANSTGLSVSGGRTLTGTRTVGTATATWTVTDADGDTATLMFTITVTPGPTEKEIADDGNLSALPELARVIGGGGAGAVVGRVGQVFSGGGGGVTIGGQKSFAAALAGNAKRDLRDVLADSSFALAGNDGGGGFALWGGAEQRTISADADGGMPSLDGGLFSAYFGADRMLGDNLLGGVMVASNQANFDYGSGASGGTHETNILTISPYLGWTNDSGGGWLAVGIGSGDVTVGGNAADADMQLLAAGGHRSLDKTIAGRGLRINAEIHSTTIDTAGTADLDAQSLGAQVLRVQVDATDSKATATGQRDFDVQLGLRSDGGDGRTGVGIEGGVRVASFNAANNVTIEGGARLLLGKSGYSEYGVYGLIRRAADGGRGLSLTLRPGYGSTATNGAVWDGGTIDTTDMTANLNAEIGYGFIGGGGLMTSYANSVLANATQSGRLGLRFARRAVRLDVFGEHRQTAAGVPSNSVLLKGMVKF